MLLGTYIPPTPNKPSLLVEIAFLFARPVTVVDLMINVFNFEQFWKAFEDMVLPPPISTSSRLVHP